MLAFFRNNDTTCYFAFLDFLLFLVAAVSSGSGRNLLAAASRNVASRWLFGGGGLAGLYCLCSSLSLSPDLGLRLGSKSIEQIRCIFAA